MTKPKILLWDIETTWGLKADIASLSTVCWRWHGEKKIHCASSWDYKEWDKDIYWDLGPLQEFAEAFEEADVQVTQYGKRFDYKFVNSRLLYWGLSPLPPVKHIDTWEVSRSKLLLSRNRLDNIARHLGAETKIHVGQGLWKKVMNRDAAACKAMEKYCKQDIEVLTQVFDRLVPVLAHSPGYQAFFNDLVCPRCGSWSVARRGRQLRQNQLKQRLRCNDCGGWSYEGAKGKGCLP